MTVILSDFDGTITKKDSLYYFFKEYADKKWLEVERLWQDGVINSKECLIQEFELVNGLCEELIDKYISNIEIDEYFKDFIKTCAENNVAFYIVSDGIDYFINKILQKNNINNLKIITNHGEFKNGIFKLTFPNGYKNCKKDSGTCKCKVLEDLKSTNEKIYYIGDGTSDFCIARHADNLFAKGKLIEYCKRNNIKYHPYKTFENIKEMLF